MLANISRSLPAAAAAAAAAGLTNTTSRHIISRQKDGEENATTTTPTTPGLKRPTYLSRLSPISLQRFREKPPTTSPPPRRLDEAVVSDWEAFRYITKFIWPRSSIGKLQTLGSFGLIALSKYTQGATPALMARLIDLLSDSKLLSEGDSEDWSNIMKCAIAISLNRALSLFARETRGALYSRVVNSANRRMASELYEVLQNAQIDFLLHHPPGELTTLVLTSSRALGGILSNLNMRAIPMYWDVVQMLKRLRQLQNGQLSPSKKMRRHHFDVPPLGGGGGGPPLGGGGPPIGPPPGFGPHGSTPHSLIPINSDIVKIAKGTLVSYFLWSFLYGERRVKERVGLTTSDINVRGGMLESLQNSEIVQANDAGLKELHRFNSLYKSYEDQQAKVQSSLAIMNMIQGLILRTGMLASTLLVSDRIFKGSNTVGALTSTQHIFDGLIHPLNFVGTMYREFKSNFRDVQSGMRLLKIPQVKDRDGARDLIINRGSVQIRNVTFSYPTAEERTESGIKEESGNSNTTTTTSSGHTATTTSSPDTTTPASAVLKNINLSIGGKSSVAIVGPSGSGKSTLLRLLMRFYEPKIGQIAICGQEINEVTLKSLRRAVALVGQETLLFNTSLKENLLYGCHEDELPTDEELNDAIQASGLTEVVQKIGLNGRVGERGSALSGGERQRVAIARAMLKKAPIVLLDEPTSGLDAQNEQLVMNAIRKLRGKSTVVTVAHKLATISDCDEIIYLENGILKERGTHQQLLTRKGLYAQSWEAQAANQDTTLNKQFSTKSSQASNTDSTCSSSGTGGSCCHD